VARVGCGIGLVGLISTAGLEVDQTLLQVRHECSHYGGFLGLVGHGSRYYHA
jgi:hypothetical protein